MPEHAKERFPIERIVLGIIAVTGVIALVAVAPGLGLVLKQFNAEKRLTSRQYVPNVLRRLQQKGLIVVGGSGLTRRVKITSTGRSHLKQKRIGLLHRPKKRQWDGYWRIVVFDIPERMRKVRTALRKELIEVGFKKLQNSVWVSPDECEEYIKLLKADRRIGKFLIYMKTKDIEYASSLQKFFRIESV